jgi:hypothetical protein
MSFGSSVIEYIQTKLSNVPVQDFSLGHYIFTEAKRLEVSVEFFVCGRVR